MRIVVNAQEREIKEGETLLGLIETLGITDKVMAAAVNMKIIKKEKWSEYTLSDGEKVELLHFVGGG